jgi:hypothetical protein
MKPVCQIKTQIKIKTQVSKLNKFSLVALILVLVAPAGGLLAKKNKQQNIKNNNAQQASTTKAAKSQVQAAPENNLATSTNADTKSANTVTASSGQLDTKTSSASSDTNGDTVLLSMAGKPVLTVTEFDEFLAEVASNDPQIGFVLQYDPIRVKEGLFENKVQLMIMGEWAKTSGIRNTEKYQAEEQKKLEQIRLMLDVQTFIQDHKVEVTAADIKAYYEKNKDTDRRLLLSPAGIEAKAVRFEKEQKTKADEFAHKLKNNPKETLENLAKTGDLDVSNLGIINDDSTNVMPEIKDAILAVQKFPHVAVVQCEDDYWVINATGKVAAKYRPLEQVQDGLRELLLPEKTKQMIDTELPKLAQKFKIVENKQYFVELKQKQAVKAEQAEIIDLSEDLDNLDNLDNNNSVDSANEFDNASLLEDIELEVQQ